MSDDERDVDVDSDDDTRSGGDKFVDKRAHHNALERKRRDHIKESFSGLRDAIPTMQGDKSSRAQILKKASEYISLMRKKNLNHQKDIEDLRRQNTHLEAQIRALEKAKNAGQFSSAQEVLESQGLNFEIQGPESTGAEATYETGSASEVSPSQPNTNTSILHVQNVRAIQPGQSLLITTTPASANGEPIQKKMKS